MATRIDDFLQQSRVKSDMCSRPEIRYPVKLVRYLLCSSLIEAELKDGTAVAEIGIDRGQMQKWLLDCARIRKLGTWDGYDIRIRPEVRNLQYSNLIEGDVTRPGFEIAGAYDVFVLVHFLEHLHEPEAFLDTLSPSLKPGGCLIGGMPVTPAWFAAAWQGRIRKTAKPFGHVSVFSPKRIRRYAEANGYCVEFLSGAFLARMSDSLIEHSRLWLEFNLWFGRRFPSLGGEIYFKLRKPRFDTEERPPGARCQFD